MENKSEGSDIPNSHTERKPGYYWVRTSWNDEWRPRTWNGREWTIGAERGVPDLFWSEIDPTPITRQPKEITFPPLTPEKDPDYITNMYTRAPQPKTLIAEIMKITPNRSALRKFMRAMCIEFDKKKQL